MQIQAQIKKRVKKILDEFAINEPPIDPRKIAEAYGINVIEQAFPSDSDISAILLKEGNNKVIAINKLGAITRKRFSIAHELAHLLLHADDSYLTVEKSLEKQLFFRIDGFSDKVEMEANQFAAELLMPEEFIKEDFKTVSDKIDIEDIISKLAKKYKVSKTAMMYRLMNLNLV